VEDFVVTTLPAHLADLLGFRRVLICAVEMTGAAMLHGVASAWTKVGSDYQVDGSAWLQVPEEARAELEQLFVQARRLQTTDDEQTIRDADYRHSRARVGKVLNSKNYGGYRRMRKAAARAT
jgi:hypothetical protein